MQHLTRDLFLAAIAAQADTFDSHDIERYFYRHHQHELIREFSTRLDAAYPVTETFRQLGLCLLSLNDAITKVDEVETSSLAGSATKCALWRKITAP